MAPENQEALIPKLVQLHPLAKADVEFSIISENNGVYVIQALFTSLDQLRGKVALLLSGNGQSEYMYRMPDSQGKTTFPAGVHHTTGDSPTYYFHVRDPKRSSERGWEG